jgi:hypothetical protein
MLAPFIVLLPFEDVVAYRLHQIVSGFERSPFVGAAIPGQVLTFDDAS